MAESRTNLEDLFHPGTGRIPPHLTGRKEEQAYFQKGIRRLLNKAPPDRDMIVYGPRGNGKTAMLGYLQKETLKETGNRLEILWVTPSEFKDMGELVDLIVGNDQSLSKKAGDLFRPLLDNLAASANIGVASVKTALNQPRARLALKALLREKSHHKPFVLIMDEAHTLDPEIGKVLLNASQDIRREDCPFFLVLAGTPNIRTALRKASATFWSRSKVFPLGRLSSEEAQEALTVPLKQHQVTFADGVVAEVANRAHRYPYFIQIWGDCIANRLVITGSREVTLDTIREAEKKARIECENMYQDRYDELDEMDLIPLAADIGRMFTDKKYIPREKFKELVGKALQEQGVPDTNKTILKNIRKLSHIGYIWQINVPIEAEGKHKMLHCYEPGIPSLMQHVQNQTLSQAERQTMQATPTQRKAQKSERHDGARR